MTLPQEDFGKHMLINMCFKEGEIKPFPTSSSEKENVVRSDNVRDCGTSSSQLKRVDNNITVSQWNLLSHPCMQILTSSSFYTEAER